MTAPTGRVFGAQPAPRVLYVFDPDSFDRAAIERIASDLSEIVPTWQVCDHQEVVRIRQASFSLAVIFGDSPTLEPSLHTIQFGGFSTSIMVTHPITNSSMTHHYELYRAPGSFATLWHVPVELNEMYKQLVIRDLVPLVPRGNVRPDDHTGETEVLILSQRGRWLPSDHMQPLLVDVDGKIFALRITGAMPWRWVLPDKANLEAWIRLILRDLHAADPVSFPIVTSWSDDNRYLTATERAAAAELANIAATKARLEQELDERENRTLREQAEAREAAERGPRMLVHAQGEDLVDAVFNVLTKLGFEVMKSDDAAAKGDKLEDLQIRLTSESEEVGLVEVRAYTGGAQLNDLLRIGRFVERYIGTTGSAPNRRWYIANQFVRSGPADRGKPLASNSAEVATFGEADGLVIASQDLLELYLRVEREEMTAEEAKAFLWRSTGYFSLD